MAEVAALFKQFLYRDLAFILGGSIVLLSLAYAFRGCIPSHWLGYWEEFQPASTVLIAAAAYVVGYAVQDVGGVLRLTSTGHFQPKRRREWLYKRFSRKEWRPINYVAENDREFKFDIHLGCLEIPERVIQELERIRSLKVISMCVGGCLLVSALIFLLNGACVASVHCRALPCPLGPARLGDPDCVCSPCRLPNLFRMDQGNAGNAVLSINIRGVSREADRDD